MAYASHSIDQLRLWLTQRREVSVNGRYLKILVCLAGLLGVYAQAQSTMCPERPIRFAHYEFGLIYSTGYGGIDDDLQKALAKRSGCKFEVSVLPRARAWLLLKAGGLDMVGSGIQTPERDQFAWFYHYILEDNVVVLGSRVGREVRTADQFLADSSLKFGGVRSYRYSPYYDAMVDSLIASGRVNEVPDPDAVFRTFERGRFDAFITNPILYLYYTKVLNLKLAKRLEDWDPAGATPSGLVLGRHAFTEAQAKQWEALISNMLQDGTILKIITKHMGPELGGKTVYRGPPNPAKAGGK